MHLQWNLKAKQDRLHYIEQIRKQNPQAALDNDRRIQEYANKLLSEKNNL